MKEVDERIDEIFELVRPLALAGADIQKLHITIWDKLVLLNAGILTLSFTAASNFRIHAIGDGGVGYLFAAWKLLIFSIVLALFAQWLAAVSTAHLQIAFTGTLTERKLQQLTTKVGNTDAKFNTPQLTAKAIRYERYTRLIAHALGLSAQVITAVAFIWLYKFAHTNLTAFSLK